MNGLGNQFTILDLRETEYPLSPEKVEIIAAKTEKTRCDQLITIEKAPGGGDGVFMGVWNTDGSRVETCGNAARCIAWLLFQESDDETVRIATQSNELLAQRVSEKVVSVDMGEPKFGWRQIPLAEQFEDTRFIDIKLGPIDNPVLWGPSAVNIGNPHCIFFVDDVTGHALERFGPMIENHPLFPERTNVSIAQATGEHSIRLRVWERGVGITKACGTAACATAVAAHRRRLTARRVTITLDGGDLAIDWREDNHVIMSGVIEHQGTGEL